MIISNNEKREYTKQDIVEKIKLAKTKIDILGATVFDLPWDELYQGILEKFLNSDFSINILCESESTISQFALLSQSQTETDNYSRGNLISIKEKVVKQLKLRLEEDLIAKGANYVKTKDGKTLVQSIEPPEDVFQKELNIIFESTKRNYILDSINKEGCQKEFVSTIQNVVANLLLKQLNGLQTKMFNELQERGDFMALSEEAKKIGELINSISSAISKLFTFAAIKKFSFDDMLRDNGSAIGYSVKDGMICVRYKIKESTTIEENVFIGAIAKAIADKIDRFISKEGNENDIINKNYNIAVAKETAVKKATDDKQSRLIDYKKKAETKQRLFIKNCYMPIPVPMLKIDDELFITHALTKFGDIDKYQYVGNESNKEGYCSYWFDEFLAYYREYFVNSQGVQKYSTEETVKGDRKEIIDIFNEDRVRIGTGPRDAFLANMGIVKSVVWALLFDRKGRVLIHQRSINAKDNRGLWDKSVGGHVGVEDLDTIEAVKREVTEELFTLENEGQGGHDDIAWQLTNKDKIIYLGDWKTSRFPDLKALNLDESEYYTFSLNFSDTNKRNFRKQVLITERLLPNGDRVEAKCFVDAYLCIVANDFNMDTLKNSKFAMLTPNELKNCINSGRLKVDEKTRYYNSKATPIEFKVTSDLKYLVNSAIWDDVVTAFSQRIREAFPESK